MSLLENESVRDDYVLDICLLVLHDILCLTNKHTCEKNYTFHASLFFVPESSNKASAKKTLVFHLCIQKHCLHLWLLCNMAMKAFL